MFESSESVVEMFFSNRDTLDFGVFRGRSLLPSTRLEKSGRNTEMEQAAQLIALVVRPGVYPYY